MSVITREEATKRLVRVERQIAEIRKALSESPSTPSDGDATQAFLAKCGGWDDVRSPDEIVADIRAARTASDRGGRIFSDER